MMGFILIRAQKSLQPDGCYLLDTTTVLLLWVGNRVDSAFLQEVFGVSSLLSSEAANLRLMSGETPLVSKINAIVQAVRAEHVTHPPLYIITQVTLVACSGVC